MSKKVLAGRYELLERRGNGGMAVVYKGKDCLLNRYVAIKILKPEFIRDPKFVNNFRHESQAAAGLSDPNIVSVYDVGREGNIYYLVMELMDGSSLGDLIQHEAPLSEKRTIEIARQVASGLSSAHKKKIIHRDIKPHNILMSVDGAAKIADFGIAKAVSGATVVNSTTTVMGSVHYLSPEQARGGYVDARTDLYSLGIVMYEMLTGNVPFDGENAVTVAMMHINNDIPAPSLQNPSVSPILDKIVMKVAARNPADRYSSADELISALDDAASGIAASASGATRMYGINGPYSPESQPHYDDGYNPEEYPEQGVSGGEEIPARENKPVNESQPLQEEKGRRFWKRKKKTKNGGARRAKVLGVVLALICAIPLSILLLHAVNSLGEDTVAIPDVLGMTEEQAASKLESKGLEYELGTSVISKKYEEGTVAGIEPEAGTHVKDGYTVTLRLARKSNSKDDSDKVKVPDVTNQTLSKARTMITDEGLKVGDVAYEYSDTVSEGSVIRQDPGGGERVPSGSTVDLTVSRGQNQTSVQVPNLMGMTRSQASNALEKLGLTLGAVTEEYSSSTIGTVMRQGVKAGTTVEKGSAVDISLSKGLQSQSSNDNSSENAESSSQNNSSNSSESSNSDDNTSNSGNSSSSSNNSSSGSNSSARGNQNSGNSSSGNGSSSSGNGSSKNDSSNNGSSSSSHGNTDSDSNSNESSSGNDSNGSGSSNTQDGVQDDD